MFLVKSSMFSQVPFRVDCPPALLQPVAAALHRSPMENPVSVLPGEVLKGPSSDTLNPKSHLGPIRHQRGACFLQAGRFEYVIDRRRCSRTFRTHRSHL